MARNILVVGSINVDQTASLRRLPRAGETCIAEQVSCSLGGKGINQAIAVHKWGGSVIFIGKVGADEAGRFACEEISSFGLSLQEIEVTAGRTGCAFINIDNEGNNTIVVDPGANYSYQSQKVCARIREMKDEISCCLMQLEIPVSVVSDIAVLCRELHIPVVLNPAPMMNVEEIRTLFPYVDLLIPNETELECLTKEDLEEYTPERACKYLLDLGIKSVLVTLGSAGALYCDSTHTHFEPALQVHAIDTTAAGDSFIGTYLVSIYEGKSVAEAMKIATRVAAQTVCTRGAAKSIPVRNS